MRVYFHSGRLGGHERGWFTFWTVLSDVGAFICRIPEDKRNVHHRLEEAARGGAYFKRVLKRHHRVRRATPKELKRWLDTHPDDARFAVLKKPRAARRQPV